jgi:hypothetical protein
MNVACNTISVSKLCNFLTPLRIFIGLTGHCTVSIDATIAYKRAVLNCIKYLAKFGYTEEQVYLMLSCIPCEGRISGIVDVPNACATLAIPLAIFDRDVRPPKTMAMLEQLANGIKVLNKDVCLSTEGGAEAKDSRLD